MLIAHVSDSHCGYSALSNRLNGINARKIDVQITFKKVLNDILSHAPDLVIHSGDLYHVIRPDNHTINQTTDALEDFQKARNYAPFVLVGGNHDSPLSVEQGNIQHRIARIPGVHFASNLSQRFEIPSLDCEVLCVPSNSLKAREEVLYRPTLGKRYSILSVHGMASQALPKAVDGKHADFDVYDLHPNAFDYIALGDYHNHVAYAPNCCFAGSTDYTSSNPWDEISTAKGYVLFDTEVGQLQHVAVPTRRYIDLPPIDAHELSVDDVQAAMLANGTDLSDSPVVRQKVVGIHASDRRKLFVGQAIKDLRAKSFNYALVCTPPTRDQGTGAVSPTGVTGSLETVWAEHAGGASIPKDVDRQRLIEAGLELLREAVAA